MTKAEQIMEKVALKNMTALNMLTRGAAAAERTAWKASSEGLRGNPYGHDTLADAERILKKTLNIRKNIREMPQYFGISQHADVANSSIRGAFDGRDSAYKNLASPLPLHLK